jgi:hypothetical protein
VAGIEARFARGGRSRQAMSARSPPISSVAAAQ